MTHSCKLTICSAASSAIPDLRHAHAKLAHVQGHGQRLAGRLHSGLMVISCLTLESSTLLAAVSCTLLAAYPRLPALWPLAHALGASMLTARCEALIAVSQLHAAAGASQRRIAIPVLCAPLVASCMQSTITLY